MGGSEACRRGGVAPSSPLWGAPMLLPSPLVAKQGVTHRVQDRGHRLPMPGGKEWCINIEKNSKRIGGTEKLSWVRRNIC
jgi:hypothetical protein